MVRIIYGPGLLKFPRLSAESKLQVSLPAPASSNVALNPRSKYLLPVKALTTAGLQLHGTPHGFSLISVS